MFEKISERNIPRYLWTVKANYLWLFINRTYGRTFHCKKKYSIERVKNEDVTQRMFWGVNVDPISIRVDYKRSSFNSYRPVIKYPATLAPFQSLLTEHLLQFLASHLDVSNKHRSVPMWTAVHGFWRFLILLLCTQHTGTTSTNNKSDCICPDTIFRVQTFNDLKNVFQPVSYIRYFSFFQVYLSFWCWYRQSFIKLNCLCI